MIEDGKVRKESKYLTDLWTEHGVKFIEQNKDRPFFLYLAYNGPYGLGKSAEPSGPKSPRRVLRRHANCYRFPATGSIRGSSTTSSF